MYRLARDNVRPTPRNQSQIKAEVWQFEHESLLHGAWSNYSTHMFYNRSTTITCLCVSIKYKYTHVSLQRETESELLNVNPRYEL